MRACAMMVLVTSAACAAPAQRGADTASADSASRVQAPATDSALFARLESDARALAKTAGCTSADACRTAPVGSRGCGGPRTYVVYCAATTDSVALYAKLDSLRDAEAAFNQRNGIASTCEMRLPPIPSASGGRCTE
jgi:hypothetical protein